MSQTLFDLPPRARPAWADDERLARVALARLVEPNDAVARELIGRMGAVGVLDLALTTAPVGPAVVSSGRSRSQLERSRARWRVRLPTTEPARDLDVLARLDGRVVVPGDDEWPDALDHLGDERPFCLFVRGGDLADLTARSLALVGARAASPYGARVSTDLAVGLTARGVVVVSGGAYGVDVAAHRGALAAGGPTVAVLACGVDRAYPKEHEDLLADVLADGALVAEVPLGTSPLPHRFLERNRLIAALTGATVVVEAAWRSGAYSTARHAACLGRPLGAVPGPVTSPTSAGCHRIMREFAATCVTDVDEAIELLSGFDAPVGRGGPPVRAGDARSPTDDLDALPLADRMVLDALPARSARPSSSVAVTAGRTTAEVEAALGRLSLLGLAVREPGGWRRAPRRRGA